MPVVVVTVTTQPAVPTSINSSSSSGGSALSSGTIAWIIIGSLLGGVLFIGLMLYLLNRRRRRELTRVANPTHVSSTSSRKKKAFPRHSQRPSVSTEPLMSQVTWPTHASTSQVHSQKATPLRSDSISPWPRDSQYSLYETDLAEISQVVAAGTITYSATPAILSIPPARNPDPASSNPSRSQSDIANAADGISPKPQQSLFLHRMLQSRAQASESVALSPSSSLGYPGSCSAAMDSSGTLVDVDALLADALRDVEESQGDVNQGDGEEDDGEDDDLETESVYSQLSAPLDHSVYFANPLSRQNSVKSALRKNSSRRPRRLPALPTELNPVAEVPDTPRTSRAPLSVDQLASLPLLTSVGFGRNNSTSNAGGGSNLSSSGGAASFSVGQNSGSGSRSEGKTGWH